MTATTGPVDGEIEAANSARLPMAWQAGGSAGRERAITMRAAQLGEARAMGVMESARGSRFRSSRVNRCRAGRYVASLRSIDRDVRRGFSRRVGTPDSRDEALDRERPAASIDTGAGTVATEPPWAGYGVEVAARRPGAEDGLFMGAGVPGWNSA